MRRRPTPGSLLTRPLTKAFSLACSVTMVVACSDSGGSATTGPDPNLVVTTVQVTPATETLNALGLTSQFTATAANASGAAISGKTFAWTSSSSTVATVNASGLATAVDNGTATITATVDGIAGAATLVVAQEAAWILVSNVAAYGGPLAFTPDGRPDSGVFEVMILHSPKLRDTPRLYFGALYNFLTRRRYPFGGVEYLPARRVRLTSPDPVPLQFDGDPGGHLPADLEILPGSVGVLGPSNQPG